MESKPRRRCTFSVVCLGRRAGCQHTRPRPSWDVL